MEKSKVQNWINKYVEVWRSPNVSMLNGLFTEDILYRVSPWKEPLHGLASLKEFWTHARSGPEEAFTLDRELVAIDRYTAVVRIEVHYAHDTPAHWRDLWIITFNEHYICRKFEEWPFAFGQDDGQDFNNN